jgi:hypothetical protein
MTQNAPTNLSASVRQRLLNLSKTRGEAFDFVLARFAIERLLYRLTKSAYADNFLLKGAMLFAVWADEIHRPTRDVDLLGFGSTESADILKIFRTVCAIPVTPDGINFSDTSVQVEPIREEARYGGVRVQLEARLAGARIPVQVDIGFGDAVTPEPETVTFPALLDFAAPVLRAYPIYSVVAEKTEAMVALGEVNTRMKDFYDLRFLAARYEFDGRLLVEALQATFKRRVTPWPVDVPVSLQEEFSSDRERAIRWRAFLRKNGLTEIDFPAVMHEVRQFIGPALAAAGDQKQESRRWVPRHGWQ